MARLCVLLLCALCSWPNALCTMYLAQCSMCGAVYEDYSTDRGCVYLWVRGLDKSDKSLHGEHTG